MMRIAVFSNENPETACARLRLRSPAEAAGLELRWASQRNGSSVRVDLDAIDWADLIVVQRFFPGAATCPVLEQILASGKPTIYEIDDLLTDIPPGSPYAGESEKLRPYALDWMAKVDAVTVSTEALAAQYAPHARRVVVLPNLLDPNMWGGNRSGSDRLLIGYCGTDSHTAELAAIEPALLNVARRYGDRIGFRFMGCATPALQALHNAEVLPFALAYEVYAKTLLRLGLDIALAPLFDNVFNRCKSAVKWLEYSACGSAGVYSDVGPYRQTVRHGITGLLVNQKPRDWERAIVELIEDSALRRELAENARREVLNHRLTVRASNRLKDAYQQIVENAKGLPPVQRIADGKETAPKGRGCVQVVTVASEDDAEIAATVDTLSAQDYSPWRYAVLAPRPSPNPLFAQLPVLSWHQYNRLPGECFSQDLLSEACDWFLLCEPGTVLDAKALSTLMDAAASNPDWRLLYADGAAIVDGAAQASYLKPDFNLELLRSQPFMGGMALVHRALFGKTQLQSTVVPLLIQELAFVVWEEFGERALGHVPRILSAHPSDWGSLAADPHIRDKGCRTVAAHLHRIGVDANVEPGALSGTLRVRYRHHETPLVSVIIPTKDKPEYIRPCVTSLLAQTRYPNFEILVVDNGTSDPEALDFLASVSQDPRIQIIPYPHTYNFSAINNAAAELARGEYLLLLNNDTEILHGEWLDELMAYGQQADVGAVGARLIFSDRTLQHAGVILGMGANGVAEHPFMGLPMDAPGYMNRAQLAQDLSAVTAACLLVRKSLYAEVGGLDQERLAVLYNDIDLCLKLRKLGYRIIWAPSATVLHHGSVSLKAKEYRNPVQFARAEREVATMLDRWLPQLSRDPAYNPSLCLLRSDYSVDRETHVDWDIASDQMRIMAMGFGSDGSWEHRARIPLHGLRRAGRAQAVELPKFKDRVRVPSVAELARENPDVLLMHNCIHDVHLEALPRYRRFTDTFLVFGQDDLMFQLPPSNPFHDQVYKDIKKRLRQAIGLCDRLVVSTEPLADAYRDMASDIVVQPNYLSADIWGRLESRRRRGAKPRVGWAGAQQHVGDLALIVDVVKRTAKEVDWVFFGLCFEQLLPYVAEVVNPVVFADYPRTLASLDLDLAIAPLEHNRFNECKSNLKVLEYGVLGIPVVCTDIEPYRSAPVARVQNRTADWLEAIRARIDGLDSAAAEGDRLRQWVHEHWLLESRLDTWLDALSPETRTDALIEASAS